MRKEIDEYIDNILQSVLNTNVHQDIQYELKDHIFSLVEEKMEEGMSEEKAIEESLSAMGNPKDIAKRFNTIYRVSKTPLMVWSGINVVFLIFFSYILSQLSIVKPLDIVVLVFHMFCSLLCLCICGKFIHNLRSIMGGKIYFSPNKTKTYTQKLVYKVIAILFVVLFLYFFISIMWIIRRGSFTELINNYDYFSLLNLTLWTNVAFVHILYYHYPKIILTKEGLHTFIEIPRLIPWEDIKGYKWYRRLGEYHLEISKGGRYRIIQSNLNLRDKIIVDNIIKKEKA